VAVLEDAGFDVTTSDVECCGMAGSFGYKSEYYELSVDVGESLVDQFTTEETADRTVVASGTSCLEQLDALLASARTPGAAARRAVAARSAVEPVFPPERTVALNDLAVDLHSRILAHVADHVDVDRAVVARFALRQAS